MIRNIKAFGAALVAILSMTALVAATAQAVPQVTTSAGTVNIHATGESIGETFSIDGVTTECKVSHYTGTVSNAATSITLNPSYTECTQKGTSLAFTVTTHGCAYVLALTETVASGIYKSHTSIECPAGKSITIISATCAVSIPAQTGLTTVTITNDASDLTIQPNVSGITANVTTDGFLCPYNGTGTKTGGKYVSEKGITATAASGSVQISGSGGPEITTSVSPVNVHATGEKAGESITIDNVATQCEVSHYTGTVSNEAASITLNPSYTNCTLKSSVAAATVTPDGCGYIFKATEKSGSTYKGTMDIECPAGKAITITSGTCAASIGAQTGAKTMEFLNDVGDVTVGYTVGGLTATVTADGFLCPFSGTGAKTGGTYTNTSGITVTTASGTIQVSGE